MLALSLIAAVVAVVVVILGTGGAGHHRRGGHGNALHRASASSGNAPHRAPANPRNAPRHAPRRSLPRVSHFALNSAAAHATLRETLLVPGSGRGRGLLVVLSSRPLGARSRPPAGLAAALARLGRRAPDLVLADTGASSYWHNRRNRRWASYIIHELIPAALDRSGARPGRVALAGAAMGGFGALDIARLAPGRFCSVRADAPGLWSSYRAAAQAAPAAFDAAADFARHDLLAVARATNPYGATPLWIDVGTRSRFAAADARLAAELRAHGAHLSFHVWSGGSHLRRALAFDARALAGCHLSAPAGR